LENDWPATHSPLQEKRGCIEFHERISVAQPWGMERNCHYEAMQESLKGYAHVITPKTLRIPLWAKAVV